MKKFIIHIGVALSFLALAAVPVAVDAATVGQICTVKADCVGTLVCEDGIGGKKCVPAKDERKIGTFCDLASNCDSGKGFLELTCDEDYNRCVGASRNVSCADAAVNSLAANGDVVADVAPIYRCDKSLFCRDSDFTCQRDLGTEFVEEIGVGSSTTDIRDQIRQIINLALGFLGVAGVILVLYGGAIWMTAAGDDEKIEKAKKTIVSGLIGLVIIGIAWTIVSYILNVTAGIG